MTKLVNEIRTAFPNVSDITSTALHELHYLGAVIEEGLRLAPPIPEGLVHVIPPEVLHIAGRWIPGGVCYFPSRPVPALPIRIMIRNTRNQPLLPASPSAHLPSNKLTAPSFPSDPRLRPTIQRQPLHPTF